MGRSLGQLDDALHAVWKAFGAELCQNNAQDSVVVAGQEMMIHALTYNPTAPGHNLPVCLIQHNKQRVQGKPRLAHDALCSVSTT